jgi:putative polyketide hydroxylase
VLTDTRVLIVGAGPTGLMTALLLARVGVECTIIEKHSSPMDFPKGRNISARSMEILRTCGLENEVRAHALPISGRIAFHASALNAVDYRRFESSQGCESPCHETICDQRLLESVLMDAVNGLAGIHIHTGLEALSIGDTNSGEMLVRGRSVLTGEPFVVAAQHVIGADGAGSTIRKYVGAKMQGREAKADTLSLLLRCDLGAVIQDRKSLLYHIQGRRYSGTFVAVDNDQNWLLMTDSAALRDVEAEWKTMLDELVGIEAKGSHLLTYRRWRGSVRLADRFRRGKVYLVGDAAHITLPTGGFGLNLALQDAHNLAWKLGALRAVDGAKTIDSYEFERRPVAIDTLAESVRQTRYGRRPVPCVTSHDYRYRARGAHGTESLSLLPHAWLSPDRRVSSRDLVKYGFTFLTWSDGVAGERFREAGRTVGLPVAVQLLKHRGATPKTLEELGLDRSSGLLVRPDCYIVTYVDDVGHLGREDIVSLLIDCLGQI